mmetsp:Transcript_25309/g.41866  ORF Transcript_25309/g.41866 Transcript_25309/m.41866 type:complete len:138 (+) Transcript_25309:71-484(+)|eukprot:CAMPEP_0119322892 /NCGR_PEP_ID=MMETSP1333-20130426/59436_1 /TAXON_ID=418940 /ORGANISM="Scyphosphaera apsteinii, Strain RCC1455" /LENGTH=137 /DNA_ID=CAMNT_0007330227 /DNA_START=61 /DNA_END=474 /DNA_ORIENTATION=+
MSASRTKGATISDWTSDQLALISPPYLEQIWWQPDFEHEQIMIDAQTNVAEEFDTSNECFWDYGCDIDESSSAFQVDDFPSDFTVGPIQRITNEAFEPSLWSPGGELDFPVAELGIGPGSFPQMDECYWDQGCVAVV